MEKRLVKIEVRASALNLDFIGTSADVDFAPIPMHFDLAGFDFSASSADARLIKELSSLEFTETAQNVVFIGGPGTGKIHLAQCLGRVRNHH